MSEAIVYVKFLILPQSKFTGIERAEASIRIEAPKITEQPTTKRSRQDSSRYNLVEAAQQGSLARYACTWEENYLHCVIAYDMWDIRRYFACNWTSENKKKLHRNGGVNHTYVIAMAGKNGRCGYIPPFLHSQVPYGRF